MRHVGATHNLSRHFSPIADKDPHCPAALGTDLIGQKSPLSLHWIRVGNDSEMHETLSVSISFFYILKVICPFLLCAFMMQFIPSSDHTSLFLIATASRKKSADGWVNAFS
jgi:hypothetical protein